MTLQEVRLGIILEVQRLSSIENLSIEEWASSLVQWRAEIGKLPVAEQHGVDTELFHPIKPKDPQ